MPSRPFTATTTTQPFLSWNPKRRALVILNNGTDTVFVAEDQPNLTTFGTPLPPGTAYIAKGGLATVPYFIVANSGSQNVRVYEGFGREAEDVTAYVTGPGTVRAAWYDRNPTTTGAVYVASSVAPHADTQRWIYTVPSLRKAIVEQTFLQIVRVTAAAPVAEYSVRITPNTDAGFVGQVQLKSIDNAVSGHQETAPGGQQTLKAANSLTSNTFDSSTGGTVDYAVSAKISEYDA